MSKYLIYIDLPTIKDNTLLSIAGEFNSDIDAVKYAAKEYPDMNISCITFDRWHKTIRIWIDFDAKADAKKK